MKSSKFKFIIVIIITIIILLLVILGQSMTRVSNRSKVVYQELAWNQINEFYPEMSRIIAMNSDDFFAQKLDEKYEFSYLGNKTYVVFDEYWKYSTVYPLDQEYKTTVLVGDNGSLEVSNKDRNLILIEYDVYLDSFFNTEVRFVFDINKHEIVGMLGID
jgi:hypothetical protein